MTQPRARDVQLVRWPAEKQRREECRRSGTLRLLVVEGPISAPISPDVREDWVRAPVAPIDLQARMNCLRARSDQHQRADVDPNGVLRYRGRLVTLSPTATELLVRLLVDFEVLVAREALSECLPQRNGETSRNALDLHVMRLRKRIRPVGLTIRTVWGRGYLLEPLANEDLVGESEATSPS